MSRTMRSLTVLSGAALALFLTAQGAGAATPTSSGDSASVAPPEAQVAFAEQGRAAGLTEEQIATLQNSANLYVFTMGGRQVALNKVVIEGKADVLIALPDEDAPRELSPEDGLAAANCAYKHFCAYSRTDSTGSVIDMYSCGKYTIPFTGPGSWDNNQTKGTVARMYDRNGKLIYTTSPARSQGKINWSKVHTVKNC